MSQVDETVEEPGGDEPEGERDEPEGTDAETQPRTRGLTPSAPSEVQT